MLVRRGQKALKLLVEPDGKVFSIDVNDVTYIGLYARLVSNNKNKNGFFKTIAPCINLASKNPDV